MGRLNQNTTINDSPLGRIGRGLNTQKTQDNTQLGLAKQNPIPYKQKPILSGQTTISQAPEKKWPLGFVGAAAKAAYDTTKSTIDNAAERLNAATEAIFARGSTEQQRANPLAPDYIKKGSTPLQTATKMGEGALGLVNIGFLPITTQMEAAKKVPILKGPATGFSQLFEKAGQLGSYTLEKTVDSLPVSQETKDTIRPLASETGALIAQIVGAKSVHSVGKKGLNTKALPIKETTKAKISKAAQITAGFSMTPFSTAFGMANARIAYRVAEKQQQGIEVTPEVGKQIIEEVKQEIKDNPIPEEVLQQKPIIENTVNSLELEKKGLLGAKKQYLEDFANTEEGYNIYQKAEVAKENSVDFNASVVSGIKQNPIWKKEMTLHDEMGRGWLMEKNGKYIVATPEQVSRFIELGWGKHLEVDSLAKEAGFENGYDYLQYNLSLAEKQGNLSSVEKMSHEYLIKNDPVYNELVQNIEDIKIKLKQYDETTAPAGIPETIKTTESVPQKESIDKNQQFTSRVFERIKEERPDLLQGELSIDRTNLREDLTRAAELIKNDKQKAYDIAMGKETSSEVLNTSVSIALAEKALAEGNLELYSKLTVKRSLDQTRRGKEIVAEKGSVTDNSVARYVKELINSRLNSVGDRYLSGLEKLKSKSSKEKAIDKMDTEVRKLEDQIKSKKLDTKTALALLEKLTCV